MFLGTLLIISTTVAPTPSYCREVTNNLAQGGYFDSSFYIWLTEYRSQKP